MAVLVTLLVGGFTVPHNVHLVPGAKDQEPLCGVCYGEHYIPKIQELSNGRAVPKYAPHLVYLTSANNPKEIEHKIIYSILNKKAQTGRYLLVCAR